MPLMQGSSVFTTLSEEIAGIRCKEWEIGESCSMIGSTPRAHHPALSLFVARKLRSAESSMVAHGNHAAIP